VTEHRRYRRRESTEPSSPYRRDEVIAARSKSYVAAAMVTLILYWVFWLPGIIANLLWYSEAKQRERVAGQSLPGVGCLSIMLWLNILVAGVVLLTLLFVTVISISTS
jgi:hypothetical protein